jgi:hypothetical protein
LPIPPLKLDNFVFKHCHQAFPDMQFLRPRVSIAAAMKLLFFLALAFFSGIEGFGLFAAYVALVLSIHLLVTKLRSRPHGQTVPAESSREPLLLADVR